MNLSKSTFLFIATCFIVISISVKACYSYSLLSGITVLEPEKGEGVSIFEIKSGTPLKNAGVKKGDIIISMDGKKISGIRDYVNYSRTLSDSKNEVKLRVKRNNQILDIIIEDYSLPIKENWQEKVKYTKHKIPKNTNPFTYWMEQGKRKLNSINDKMSYKQKINIYEKAIENIYYALHHNPKKALPMVLIADTYKKIGEISITNGLKEEAVEYFKTSIRLYKKIVAKTDMQKENLIEIRDNLKSIETILKQELG